MLKLIKHQVGPWPMNTYLILCENTSSCAIVDPGAEAYEIMNSVKNYEVKIILITHGHPDHIGALTEIREWTKAPVYIHPLDGELFNVKYDRPFENNGILVLGEMTLRTIFTRGHTPGSTCIDLGRNRMVVGDTIFTGGPGHTSSVIDFQTTLETMKSIVFTWPDETMFFPGHGDSGVIGIERNKFEAFLARERPEDLCGDVIWE